MESLKISLIETIKIYGYEDKKHVRSDTYIHREVSAHVLILDHWGDSRDTARPLAHNGDDGSRSQYGLRVQLTEAYSIALKLIVRTIDQYAWVLIRSFGTRK